jgi:hypothetical protein
MTRVSTVLAAILVPAVSIWWLGHLTAGLIVSGIALAVIGWYAYRAWAADREQMRRYREAVWQRRCSPAWIYIDADLNITERTIRPARAFTVIKGGKEKGPQS